MRNAELKTGALCRFHSEFRILHSAFESGLWCNSSISAREADGPGANPGFLTKKENARRSLK
jgi:hypothetical protein